jgi:recombinational DNA repair protein RecR
MDGLPTMSPGPQHLRALQRANHVRLARAELKRRIAEGELTAAEVILASPWEADGMAIADVLMSQRRWGGTRCRKFLAMFQISEAKTVGSLTQRQRIALGAQLEAHATIERSDRTAVARELSRREARELVTV